MVKYAVEITPKAQWDMDEAFDYIAFQLENPQAAYDLIDGIYSATGDLSSMPERFPVWKRGSMGPKGAGKLNPMLMINLLAWKDAHGCDLPFVALSLYWPKHAPNAFHAVCVGLEDVVTTKAPVADTPPKAKTASVEKDPSDEMPEIKIGKLARAAFPVLFGEGKVTADDVAYLCSKAAEKDFKSRSNQVLKETTVTLKRMRAMRWGTSASMQRSYCRSRARSTC